MPRNFYILPLGLSVALVAVVFLSPGTDAVRAAPTANIHETGMSLATDWVSTKYAATRLVSAQTAVGPGEDVVQLGFEVNLEPGWKTYWRSPGDAGAPPSWHWGKAENVAGVTVDWPLPKRVSLSGIDSLVYEKQVVFPITLKLARQGAPVALDLTVDYYVCAHICVPLQGHYRLDIPASKAASRPTREAPLVADFKDRVPQLATERNPEGAEGMKITRAYLEKEAGATLLRVQVAGAGPMSNADLFVEGPDRLGFGAALRKTDKQLTLATFDVPVYSDGQDIGALLAGSPLTLTLTDGAGKAAEFRVRVN